MALDEMMSAPPMDAVVLIGQKPAATGHVSGRVAF
jgi:hypothetical protein